MVVQSTKTSQVSVFLFEINIWLTIAKPNGFYKTILILQRVPAHNSSWHPPQWAWPLYSSVWKVQWGIDNPISIHIHICNLNIAQAQSKANKLTCSTLMNYIKFCIDICSSWLKVRDSMKLVNLGLTFDGVINHSVGAQHSTPGDR